MIFAVLGAWIPAAGLFAGLCLCLLGMRAVKRRLHADRDGHDRDQARPDAAILP